MSTRKINRKRPNTLARTARRTVPAPRFTRVTRSIKLVVPPDCDASLILKQVGHDGDRYYAWWLLVGRHDDDAMTVPYKHTGEDTIRCDIPSGTPLSSVKLQPFLTRFLKQHGNQGNHGNQGLLEGDPPVIK